MFKPIESDKFSWGGSLQGYFDCSFKELVSLFGQPNSEGDGYKVSTEWLLSDGQHYATLYEYKETDLYESDGLTVEEFRKKKSHRWHIGAQSPEAAEALIKHMKAWLIKPMLAGKVDLEKLEYPAFASPKLDGIRCLVLKDGTVVSRSLKPIRNQFIVEKIKETFGNNTCFDGEIVVSGEFAATASKVMTQGYTECDFSFGVFDTFNRPDDTFEERYEYLLMAEPMLGQYAHIVHNTLVENEEELMAVHAAFLAQGYEGTMVRSLQGRYKFGRSTTNEGFLLKLKDWISEEAVIVGFEERMHNSNEATTNALGHTERSTAKAGLVPMGTLGALLCERGGLTFGIGTGFDDATRQDFWDRREELKGQMAKFKYFEIGSKGKPRFPVFEGIRHEDDISS